MPRVYYFRDTPLFNQPGVRPFGLSTDPVFGAPQFTSNQVLDAIASAGQTPQTYGMVLPTPGRAYKITGGVWNISGASSRQFFIGVWLDTQKASWNPYAGSRPQVVFWKAKTHVFDGPPVVVPAASFFGLFPVTNNLGILNIAGYVEWSY